MFRLPHSTNQKSMIIFFGNIILVCGCIIQFCTTLYPSFYLYGVCLMISKMAQEKWRIRQSLIQNKDHRTPFYRTSTLDVISLVTILDRCFWKANPYTNGTFAPCSKFIVESVLPNYFRFFGCVLRVFICCFWLCHALCCMGIFCLSSCNLWFLPFFIGVQIPVP